MGDHRLGAGQQLRRLAAVALVLGTALLAGCSSDEPRASETLPTESPTTTTAAATTTPELPPLGPVDFPVPAEARTQDEAGAEAFLEYLLELINRQLATPDGQPFRDLGLDCNECSRIASRLDEAAASGQTFQGGRISLNGKPGMSVTTGEARLSFLVTVQPGAQLGSDGEPIEGTSTQRQAKLPSAAILTWSLADTSWLVSAINFG